MSTKSLLLTTWTPLFDRWPQILVNENRYNFVPVVPVLQILQNDFKRGEDIRSFE